MRADPPTGPARTTGLPALLLALLTGCAAGPGPDPLDRAMDSALEEGIEPAEGKAPGEKGVEVPEPVADALLPPMREEGEAAEPPEQRFDVTARGTAAREFFLGLAEGTPYNVVVQPEVTGTIDLELKNVTVPETLQVVREVYGYDYREIPGGYHVLPNTLQTRMYQVDYLRMVRSGDSQTQASPGQVSSAQTGSSGSGDSGGGRTRSAAVSSSRIQTRSQSDFWQELAATLKALVGQEDGRKVTINPQAGLVLVRGGPSDLRQVEDFLERLQEVVHRQVIIEARVLEVELGEDFQAGINWAALHQDDGYLSALDLGTSGSSSVSGTVSSGTAGRSVSTTGEFGSSVLTVNTSNFTALIDMLETQGDVKVLSRPRVSTVNNQKAVIKVGSDEFFVTDISSETTTTGATTSTGPDVELTPFFSGVTLDVTPQISENDEIILHVHPSVSEVTEEIKEFTVGTTITAPLATSTIRESDSVIRAQSGQVVVIGGLMRDSSRDDSSSVPLLGDLPGVGQLFSHQRRRWTKSELVILLRPVVVEGRGWSDALRQSSQRIRTLRQERDRP